MPTIDLHLPPRALAAAYPGALSQTTHPVVAAYRLVARWIERARQRQALGALDDHMLRDIGVTRVEARRECEKPFWS